MLIREGGVFTVRRFYYAQRREKEMIRGTTPDYVLVVKGHDLTDIYPGTQYRYEEVIP